MERVSQEFYCHECDGYFLVRLNTAINHEVEVRCPNCGHEHRRCIVHGQILENGRYKSDVREKILTSMANYSKTPRTHKMQEDEKSKKWGRRDGVIIERDPQTQIEFNERWLNVAQRQLTGEQDT